MLSAQGLACVRGDRLVFKDLSFELSAGGLLTVLGGNGSGKSSLLRLLGGLLVPVAGVVHWCDHEIKQVRENYQAQLVYIGHLNGLKEDLTALENLDTNARLAGNTVDTKKALAALTAIGLGSCAHLPVRVLSQGQKRRVALARLWLTECVLWLLDEPFAALDALSVDVLAARLSQHLAVGGMIVLATHQEVAVTAKTMQVLRLTS